MLRFEKKIRRQKVNRHFGGTTSVASDPQTQRYIPMNLIMHRCIRAWISHRNSYCILCSLPCAGTRLRFADTHVVRWEMQKTGVCFLKDSTNPTQLLHFIVLCVSWHVKLEVGGRDGYWVSLPKFATGCLLSNSLRPLHGSRSWSVVQWRIRNWSSDPSRWDQDTFSKSWSVVQWRILSWSSDPSRWDQDTFSRSWPVVQWRILNWSSDPWRWDQDTFSKSWSVFQWRILNWSSDPSR